MNNFMEVVVRPTVSVSALNGIIREIKTTAATIAKI